MGIWGHGIKELQGYEDTGLRDYGDLGIREHEIMGLWGYVEDKGLWGCGITGLWGCGIRGLPT